VSIIKLSELNILGDNRGSLVALESLNNVPFDIKRVYYIYNTLTDIARGFHAHKQLQQLAICVSGSCTFVMDDGIAREEVILNEPNKAIFIDKMIWHEMYNFTPDCILLVVASDVYDELDYIRKYEHFKSEISNASV
jgi:dTDP-4-dehydrorhamnose 3,5-epimerase-like enzyme